MLLEHRLAVLAQLLARGDVEGRFHSDDRLSATARSDILTIEAKNTWGKFHWMETLLCASILELLVS